MKILEVTDQLPPDVAQAFEQMGDQQRGEPELVMAQAQQVMAGGNFGAVIEHVGDITHRMTRQGGLKHWGLDEAAQKIERGYRWLNSGYGFDREFQAGLKHAAEHQQIPLEEMQRRAGIILNRYADAHSKLPVYNRAQWLARQAAIALGRQRWDSALSCLAQLRMMSREPAMWQQHADEYHKGGRGNLMPYT
jgi:hypothetical protein